MHTAETLPTLETLFQVRNCKYGDNGDKRDDDDNNNNNNSHITIIMFADTAHINHFLKPRFRIPPPKTPFQPSRQPFPMNS
jgi:hypothetical protein